MKSCSDITYAKPSTFRSSDLDFKHNQPFIEIKRSKVVISTDNQYF